MTAIDDLIAELYGGGAEKTIAAENPYTPFQAVPDSLQSIIGGLAAKGGGGYGLGELAGTSAITGALSGLFQGLGNNYKLDTMNAYQSAIKNAFDGKSNAGIDLSPTLLSKANNVGEMALLKRDLEEKDAIMKASSPILGQQRALDILKRDNPDSPLLSKNEEKGYTPEQLAALKLPPTATKEQADFALKLMEREDKDKPKKVEVPAALQTSLAESKAIADSADEVAGALKKSGKSWADLQSEKMFSGLDKDGIQQRIADLTDRVLRSRSGSAAPLAEQAKLKKIIAGDFSAGPDQIANLLSKFADLERSKANSEIDVLEAAASGNLRQAFGKNGAPANQPSNISAGAIPTGRTTRTGQPTYIVNGVEGVLE